MYAELLVRREEMAAKLADASAEEIEALGKEQIAQASKSKEL
jgi:hypothetical protein